MSVFFSVEPTPKDRQLAELWHLLENEYFQDAIALAEPICQAPDAPVEFLCGLSLAYGECGYYPDAEQVARTAVGFGEDNWRARHALAVSLLHQGRFLGALDSLGFHRDPDEIYVIRAQVENMGEFVDSARVTLEDALQKDVPPAIRLYLAYLYAALGESVPNWPGQKIALNDMTRYRDHLDVWERDLARHQKTPYGQYLARHIRDIQHVLKSRGGGR